MGILTLTTDMGLKDYYVASLKGKILSEIPSVQIVDISHQISPFKIIQAVNILKGCLNDFPENTVHVIGVDGEPLINFAHPEDSIFPIIAKYKGQYFIGADNGFVSLLVGSSEPEAIWRLEDVLSQPGLMNFPEKNIFVPAACKILLNKPIDNFASAVKQYKKLLQLQPAIDENTIRGVVSHIDHYGNIITNITKDDFNSFDRDKSFIIYFRRKEYYIDKISTGYNEVPRGEKVAIFNDSGHLEIAINKGTPENGGGANSLLGLSINDIILIEFETKIIKNEDIKSRTGLF